MGSDVVKQEQSVRSYSKVSGQTRQRGSRIQWRGRSFRETKQVYLTYLGTPVPPFLPHSPSTLLESHLCIESALRAPSPEPFPPPSNTLPLCSLTDRALLSSPASSSLLHPVSPFLSLRLGCSILLAAILHHLPLLHLSYSRGPAPVPAIKASFPKVSGRLTTIGIVQLMEESSAAAAAGKKGYQRSLLYGRGILISITRYRCRRYSD